MLGPLLDRRRHPRAGVRRGLRRKINGLKRSGTSSLSENMIVGLWCSPAAEAGETLPPQVILGQFLTRLKFEGGRGPAEEYPRFSSFLHRRFWSAGGRRAVHGVMYTIVGGPKSRGKLTGGGRIAKSCINPCLTRCDEPID